MKHNDISGVDLPGLYLVPSPLGNLGDLTLRVIEVIKKADMVCAEDTRRTLKLLNYLEVKVPLISYREQNHQKAWPKIAEVLAAGGKVALLTDAGSPAVSDPGAALAAAARADDFSVIPLPGPSAVISALMASGFSADRFTFAGFLPAKTGERRDYLQSLAACRWTLVFFETPHRLAASLVDLAEIFGDRQALLAREMTKLHEEYFFSGLEEMAEEVARNPRKGEMTLVVQGFSGQEEIKELDLEYIRKIALEDQRPVKVLAAELAVKYKRGRAELYKILTGFRRNEESGG